MKYLFTHAHLIIDDYREYLDGTLVIDGEKIVEVFHDSDHIDDKYKEYKILNLNNHIVMPGFFDTHIHGDSGICFDNCTRNEFDIISRSLAFKGTTSFLSSLSYRISIEKIFNRLKELNLVKTNYSRLEGFHLEGPFLNKDYVDDSNNILKYNSVLIKRIVEYSDLIKQITVACDIQESPLIIESFKNNNIKVLCGHSNALINNLDNIDGITHLFVYMDPFDCLKDTLVNSAFSNNFYVEIIANEKYINSEVLKLILNNINKDRIILISNSCGSKGISLSINEELKLLKKLGYQYTDLLSYSSLNAYRFYGFDNKYGSLVKGKCSDIVIMDDDLNIINVLIKGELIQ